MNEWAFYVLDPQHLLFILFGCVAATALCVTYRQSGWMVILWLPSFVLTVGYTCLLASLFIRGFTGHGENAGWLFFAGMLQAFATFPIVGCAIALLFCRPTKAALQPRYLMPAVLAATVSVVTVVVAIWHSSRNH